MQQEIYIIDDNDDIIKKLTNLFKNEKEFKFRNVKTEKIDIALKNIPSIIIIIEDEVNRDVLDICKKIREDEDNKITPVIVVSSNIDKEHRIKIMEQSIEYYIKKPIDEQYFYYTIKNLSRLISTNRRVSPLTGLPGNVQILAELKKRLINKEKFSVLYLDLDNFKAYNDFYGFIKGDNIISYTAEIITNIINKNNRENTFIGHIGGDDFVAIVSDDDIEDLCQIIIATFDSKINKYFSEEDLKKGYLEVENRKGKIEQFPLTSLSIGVVICEPGRFKNVLEIGEVGAQVKHLAKTVMGSSYAIDRRKE